MPIGQLSLMPAKTTRFKMGGSPSYPVPVNTCFCCVEIADVKTPLNEEQTIRKRIRLGTVSEEGKEEIAAVCSGRLARREHKGLPYSDYSYEVGKEQLKQGSKSTAREQDILPTSDYSYEVHYEEEKDEGSAITRQQAVLPFSDYSYEVVELTTV